LARLITFRHEGNRSAGRLEEGTVVELNGELPRPGDATGRVLDFDKVDILAPVPSPPSVRDFYAFEEHVANARKRRGLDMVPEWYDVPAFYFSNPAATVGPEEAVSVPPMTEALDFELEVALIVRRDGSDIPAVEAWDYVAGLTIMNDWSARDVQRKEMAIGLGPAKGKDFATSLGPWLVTLDELKDKRNGDRHDLRMTARINGNQVSEGNTADLYWSFPQMIEHASRGTRLRAGDVIGSGTVGSGCILELGPENVEGWLKPGDIVELEIERLGILRNRVAGLGRERRSV